MTKQLAGKTVSEDLFDRARRIRAMGGRVFVCTAADEGNAPGVCTNCDGGGALVLQTVYGGPYDFPPATHVEAKGDMTRVATVIDGKWHKVNNVSYECSVCRGSGRVGPVVPSPAPISKAWDAMVEVAVAKGGHRTKEERERYGSL